MEGQPRRWKTEKDHFSRGVAMAVAMHTARMAATKRVGIEDQCDYGFMVLYICA